MPGRDSSAPAGGDGSSPSTGDVYTMTEAARLKGVSYHTVSRAVRRGKLPAQRLGRMALIAAEDLRRWRPMRERAPRKYRRREPNPDAAPALLDLASGERVELARRLSTLYEVIHSAAVDRELPDFLHLLSDRVAGALEFRRVAIWGIDEDAQRVTKLASYGPPLSDTPDTIPLADTVLMRRLIDRQDVFVAESLAALGIESSAAFHHITSFFVAPLRTGNRLLGFIFGDCDGEPFTLSPAQLSLAQSLANQAALALDLARFRAADLARARQLEAILENVSDAVFAFDADGRVTLMNAADRELLGFDDRSPDLTQHVLDVSQLAERRELDGRPMATEDTPMMRALAGVRVRNRQYLVRRRDGREIAINVNAQPIRDETDNAIVGAVAVARDITFELLNDQREAHQRTALQTAAARASAVAAVALAVNAGTDLRSVLETAIARMTELLGGISGTIFFREADGRIVGQVGYRLENPAEELSSDLVEVPTTMVAFARRAPLFYTYAEAASSERVYFDKLGFRATLIAPLIVSDELIGAAYVNYPDEQLRLTDDDLGFAAALASQCAVAIEKTRLLDRLESAHNRLLAVIDQLPQAVVIVESADGGIALANRAAEELWGDASISHETSLVDLRLAGIDGKPFPPGENPLERTLRTGQAELDQTVTVVRSDGATTRTVMNVTSVVDAAGRTVGAVGVFQGATTQSD